jgi:hypothetical protein
MTIFKLSRFPERRFSVGDLTYHILLSPLYLQRSEAKEKGLFPKKTGLSAPQNLREALLFLQHLAQHAHQIACAAESGFGRLAIWRELVN